MSMENPSIISHVSVGSNDFDKAVAFYDAVLATIDAKRMMEHPGAVAYGKQFPEFWVQVPFDQTAATVGNGTHVGFITDSREKVDAFYKAALAAGAKDNGAPGGREHYGKPYYGCFVEDLDGNRIEAMFWDFAMAGESGA